MRTPGTSRAISATASSWNDDTSTRPDQVAPVHDLGQRPGRRDVLDLGLQRAGDGVQDLLEDRDPLAAPGVQGAQLGEGLLGDRPRAVGRTVHVGVVHDDERAVLAQMQVEFDHVEARVLRGGKDRRVFSGSTPITPR